MTYPVLKNANFRNLWLGQSISQLGDAFYYLVFAFMVDFITKDPRIVSAVLVVQALPFLFISPIAGTFADRLDRRKILLFCDISSALILGLAGVGTIVFGSIALPWIFVLGFALSVVNSFFGPAKNACIPRIVPAEELNKANSLSSATQYLMPLIGIAGSAGLMGALEQVSPKHSFAIAMLINAASFLASAYYVRRIPTIIPEREAVQQNQLQDLKLGLSYVAKHPVLRVTVFLSFLTSFFIGPFFPVYIATNREWFGGHYPQLGMMEASFFGSMVFSSLWLGKHPVSKIGVAFCWGVLVTGLFIVSMAISRNFGWFLVWNFACGFSVPFASIPVTVYCQSAVPDEFRGRVSSVMMMAGQGVQPLSIAIGGYALARLGVAPMYIIMGIGFMGAGFLGFLFKPFRTARLSEADAKVP